MPYEMSVVEVAARPLAAARGRATLASLAATIVPLFDTVYAHLRARAIPNLGLNFLLYTPLTDTDFTLDAGVEIHGPFPATEAVRYLETPAGRAVTTTHLGPYEDLPAAHAAIRAWAEANGEPLAGPNWEAYDHWHDDPAKRRTDVFYLLSRRSR
jgi:effector-binding domain-containing protein